MTEVRFKADGATGKVAIYDYTAPNNNDNPFTAPLSNLSRVHFHSDLSYVGFETSTPSISTSVSINGSGAYYYKNPPHNLGAHGKSGIPFLYGRIFVSGRWLPLCGTIPVVVWQTNENHNLVTVALAVDATNVYLAEQRSYDSAGAFSTFSANVEIWASEVFSP